jgi:glycosyltransferase involved in cell wall biosynthesis
MKIGFLSDSIYPFNKGGKETRSFELATQLAKRGHDVDFYTMKFWKGSEIIKQNNFNLHGICKNYPLYEKKRRSIKQAIKFGFSAFKLIRKDFEVLDADHMVYFHLWPAKLICWIRGKPLVITWHEVWGKEYWQEYMGKKGIIGAWMEKLSSKLANKIISISPLTTRNLIEKLNVPKNKIVTIPNGINFKEIKSVKPAKEKSDLIYAGRLLSHKNVDVLIQSVKELTKQNPKIKCIIIGDGPERESLEKLTKQLKLEKNIIFKGFIEKLEDVYALIKSSKVFVLPSTREGFGIALIGANACGIPVITTNHRDNASKDLIKEGKNGFISKLNEKEIKKKVEKGLKDYKKMKKTCISSAEKFDWNKIINKFEGVYTG